MKSIGGSFSKNASKWTLKSLFFEFFDFWLFIPRFEAFPLRISPLYFSIIALRRVCKVLPCTATWFPRLEERSLYDSRLRFLCTVSGRMFRIGSECVSDVGDRGVSPTDCLCHIDFNITIQIKQSDNVRTSRLTNSPFYVTSYRCRTFW